MNPFYLQPVQELDPALNFERPWGILQSAGSTPCHRSTNLQQDPRTVDWFLVRSPIPVLIVIFSYIYFVQHLGPKLMQKHSPFNLSTVIMVYNVAQIVHNVWILNEVQSSKLDGGEVITFSVNPSTIHLALRLSGKKNNQITPLHVLHHSGMPAVAFICVRYYPGGHGTLTGLLNTFVHSVMYFYYFIAGLGPRFKKYLWWKQYLTLLQMEIIVSCGVTVILRGTYRSMPPCNCEKVDNRLIILLQDALQNGCTNCMFLHAGYHLMTP
uniref:Elongation of very long chain fatty acids protein n=1 Tax=Timema genevievae TaxID=629358 RepID=A0A7R9K734_TIMGE|nr:unnamed protein product [Timema genevievae]